ncbi:DUF2971 domain-containing protein [Serratia aquatilis]|uniref:DUF2971 domain-containing protein n=1 Tax=Serratia aquatilis TaxID=1737515 RepID=A0ABV6EAS4_9GAMM
MKLYKYMSYGNFEKFIDSGCVVFSNAQKFNDVFEVSNYFSENLIIENESSFEKWLRPITNISNSVILCLTRNPLNTLMWAHYADSHKGVVIGIDIYKTDMILPEENILPAQFGNIIYTHTRPSNDILSKENIANGYAQKIEFDLRNMEALQRKYLYKSAEWAYEEEVRIVKHCNYSKFKKSEYYQSFSLMELPFNSVVEIYFGINFEKNKMKKDTYVKLTSKYKNLALKQCSLNLKGWNLLPISLSENDFIANEEDDKEWVPIKVSSFDLIIMKSKEKLRGIIKFMQRKTRRNCSGK